MSEERESAIKEARAKLLSSLKRAADGTLDRDVSHWNADAALLRYINDDEVSDAYFNIDRDY